MASVRTMEEAFLKAIKAYWKGEDFGEMQSTKKSKYNKKYFDRMEDEFVPKDEKKSKKEKEYK